MPYESFHASIGSIVYEWEVVGRMAVRSRAGKQAEEKLPGFFSIAIQTLRLDEVIDFDLYLPPASATGEPVLYRRKSLPFSEEARDRLVSNAVDEVYVADVQRGPYQRYLERNLGNILADSSVSMEERVSRLYDSAQGLVREVLEDPRSGGMVERSGELVEHMVRFLYAEGTSFEHLMKITSYDYYTYTHSVNVFVYTTALAQHLRYDEAIVQRLGQGALLHDVGKSMIDTEVTNSKGRLAPAQWAQMQQHPAFGYDILMEQGYQDPIGLDVVRHHHEKLTGRGYPDGLGGDDVSGWVRMSTIADIFDALTTRRSYKEAMHTFEALQLMNQKMRKELDTAMFREFVSMMGKHTG